MNRLKVIKTKKRKMTYQDLSWGVHPKMSGMQAQIELDNGFLVSVIYLDHEQLEHPGFECFHVHTNLEIQRCIQIQADEDYKPQKSMSIEGVNEYIQAIQKLPKPIVFKNTFIKSSKM
jgi:hypothetical protein